MKSLAKKILEDIKSDERIRKAELRNQKAVEKSEKATQFSNSIINQIKVGNTIKFHNADISILREANIDKKVASKMASQYRKNPSDEEYAISYALRYAIKLNEVMIVYPSNSYMNFLWRVERVGEFDILNSNNFEGFSGWLVIPEGKCYQVKGVNNKK